MPCWRLGAVGVAAGEAEAPVRELGVGGPDLAPADPVAAVDRHGAGGERGQVAPGVGLAEELAPQLARREDPGEEALLLLGRPVGQQGGSHEVDADAAHQLGGPGPRQLLDHHVVLERPQAAAAVLLGPGEPDPAVGRQLGLPPPPEGDRLGQVVEAGREPDAVGPRQVLHQPGPERRPQRLLLSRGVQIHRPQHGTAAARGDTRVSGHRRLRRRGLRPLSRPAGAARCRGHPPRRDGRVRRPPGPCRDRSDRRHPPRSGCRLGRHGGRRAAGLRRRRVVRHGGAGVAGDRAPRGRGRPGAGHGGARRAVRGDRPAPGGGAVPAHHRGARRAVRRRGAGGRRDQGLARGAGRGGRGGLRRRGAGDRAA